MPPSASPRNCSRPSPASGDWNSTISLSAMSRSAPTADYRADCWSGPGPRGAPPPRQPADQRKPAAPGSPGSGSVRFSPTRTSTRTTQACFGVFRKIRVFFLFQLPNLAHTDPSLAARRRSSAKPAMGRYSRLGSSPRLFMLILDSWETHGPYHKNGPKILFDSLNLGKFAGFRPGSEKGTLLTFTVRGPSANLAECHEPLGRSRSTGGGHPLSGTREKWTSPFALRKVLQDAASPAPNRKRPWRRRVIRLTSRL